MNLKKIKKNVTFNGKDFCLIIKHVGEELAFSIFDDFGGVFVNTGSLDISSGTNKEGFDNSGYIWAAESIFSDYKKILDDEIKQNKKNEKKINNFKLWDGIINIGNDGDW
jgi:hypothetical protein